MTKSEKAFQITLIVGYIIVLVFFLLLNLPFWYMPLNFVVITTLVGVIIGSIYGIVVIAKDG